MKTYEWILFDADDTLFHFDAWTGLQRMFAQYGINFTPEDHEAYEAINQPLWKHYQNGTITAEELQNQRFDMWALKLGVSAQELNMAFMNSMAEICTTLDGAINLLSALQGKVQLGIITNGFTHLMQARLQRTGLASHFDLLVISEEAGMAKPQKGIFDYALSMIGNPLRDRVLMVGDNPESDILGGINAGIDTCWLNTHNKPLPTGIVPMYQVASLSELQNLLLDEKQLIATVS
ncbi:MAG: pyrimidine 5'-nucleotidase [Gammaproteobacteria bacterium]|nr:pyrimidine 5'-nucleotidase [Gammaproteobacteria bacterium]